MKRNHGKRDKETRFDDREVDFDALEDFEWQDDDLELGVLPPDDRRRGFEIDDGEDETEGEREFDLDRWRSELTRRARRRHSMWQREFGNGRS